MLNRIGESRRSWLFWIPLSAVFLVLFWTAPEEQSLGQGIRSVYVHVGLIWAGMAGIVIAGLLGLIVLLSAKEQVASWMQTTGWVALAFYAGGVAMSALASKENWGGVFWQEPRMRVALNMLAVALIVQVLISWLPWSRVRGMLALGLPVALAWTTSKAPLVLHPSDPIRTSTSTAIQASFFGFFILSLLAATWLIWYWQPPRRRKPSS
jgi:hypothetical protein